LAREKTVVLAVGHPAAVESARWLGALDAGHDDCRQRGVVAAARMGKPKIERSRSLAPFFTRGVESTVQLHQTPGGRLSWQGFRFNDGIRRHEQTPGRLRQKHQLQRLCQLQQDCKNGARDLFAGTLVTGRSPD
jgi:hypothetical protein